MQRDQVARADPPPGAGEQPQQRRAVGRVGEHPQRADHVADLGGVQQAAEADDLDRQATRPQGLLEGRDLAADPDQDGTGRPPLDRDLRGGLVRHPGRGAPGREHRVGDPFRLVGVRRQQRARDGVSAHPLGDPLRRYQLGDPGAGRPQRPGQGVRDVQDLRPVAPALGQVQHPRVAAARPGELGREPVEGARRGAAPAVDRLARVTHRGDRVAAAEERVEHDHLGVAGVLVLVEQHHLEPAAFDRADLGMVAGDPRGPGHLVTEVHRLDVEFALLVQPDQG